MFGYDRMCLFFEYCFCISFYFGIMFMGFYCQNYLEPLTKGSCKDFDTHFPLESSKQQENSTLQKIKED